MKKTELLRLQKLAEEATQTRYWTCKGRGVFSSGQEGVALQDENDETGTDDLNFIAAMDPITTQKIIEMALKYEDLCR